MPSSDDLKNEGMFNIGQVKLLMALFQILRPIYLINFSSVALFKVI